MRTTTELSDEGEPPRDSDHPDLSGPDAAGTFGSAVRTWLYGIATNLVRQHVRAELRALEITARATGARVVADTNHDGVVADRVDAQVAARQLATALAQLSPGDRDVLLLVSLAGLDNAEVAEALGIPAGTVRSRLHRVRKQLRAHVPSPSSKDAREGDDCA